MQCLGKTSKKYIPVNSSDYGYKESKEPGSARYNVVLHKKEKFETLDTDKGLKNVKVFLLMEVKQKTYKAIYRGGDEIKTKAIKKKLNDDWKKNVGESEGRRPERHLYSSPNGCKLVY